MYFLLDLSKKGIVHLGLFDDSQSKTKKIFDRDTRALVDMDAFLREEHISPADLQGIAIVSGAGSFTSTRIAVVIANVFAYIFSMPVFSICEKDANDRDAIMRIFSGKGARYALPAYSGEPNVGKKTV